MMACSLVSPRFLLRAHHDRRSTASSERRSLKVPEVLAVLPNEKSPRLETALEVRIDSPKRRGAACIPGYDSSGAQTRPCD